jgi:hypothetical protein
LKSILSAPTNNNDIVIKEYVDSLIPDLSIYLTINDVYIQPQTGLIDLTVVEVVDPEGHKLVTKKYLDSVIPDSSTFLTINNTTSIANTGHYLSKYNIYNYNNEIQPKYYPLSTKKINNKKFKLTTQGYVYDLVNSIKPR